MTVGFWKWAVLAPTDGIPFGAVVTSCDGDNIVDVEIVDGATLEAVGYSPAPVAREEWQHVWRAYLRLYGPFAVYACDGEAPVLVAGAMTHTAAIAVARLYGRGVWAMLERATFEASGPGAEHLLAAVELDLLDA